MNIDLFDDKAQAMFRDLISEAAKARGLGANFKLVLADAVRAMKRENKRAETLPAEYERQEIKPNGGPTIEFTGRLLANDEWETRGRDPMRVEFEIWETRAGAMVAVSASEPLDREGVEVVRATVVEAGQSFTMDGANGGRPMLDGNEAQRMRLAVMAHFEWHDRARSMARKLGWGLRVEVE